MAIGTRVRTAKSAFGSSGLNLRKTLVVLWDAVAADLGPSYRPEKYYMRGPGPKCRRKQASVRRFKERA
jgi:hypothetical protein